jgi:catechol 2,3-dioxygenase-like lactoylglutathione lyase family enzyme
MLHHIELYVRDLEQTVAFWTPFMEQLDWRADRWSGGMNYLNDGLAYLCFLQAPEQHLEAGYHRQRIGLNHLAFQGKSREHVDAIAQWVRDSGHPFLYADRYPFAGGANYYALYCEDPNRFKVEVVAP